MDNKNVDLNKVKEYFKELERSGFFGKTVISWQNGKIVNLKLDLSLDLDQLRAEG